MPKKKTRSLSPRTNKRRVAQYKVTVSLGDKQKKMWDALENKSKFMRLALDNAISIMQWDIMRKGGYPEPKRKVDYRKTIRTYNLMNPLPYNTKYANKHEAPPLESSPNTPDLW